MREIDIYDLKRMLPDEEHEKPTDEYFLTLAKYIATLPGEMKVMPEQKQKNLLKLLMK